MLFIAALLVFDIVAWKWSSDSQDGLYSPEWERRRAWLPR